MAVDKTETHCDKHMKFTITLLPLLLILCPGVLSQDARPSVNDLGWLSGCWEATRNGREINEQWMKPAGQTMLGMGRTVADGKKRGDEFLQIREEKDGTIYYVAKPSGQP